MGLAHGGLLLLCRIVGVLAEGEAPHDGIRKTCFQLLVFRQEEVAAEAEVFGRGYSCHSLAAAEGVMVQPA